MTNKFRLLVGPDMFTEALQTDLDNCQHSLYVQFSTFEGDASGEDFARLLTKKANEGADVRLIIDYYSDAVLSDTYPFLIHRRGEVKKERAQTHAILAALETSGVGIKRTAPTGPLWIYFPFRDHKKMVVLDEQIAYVGGINISDHNYAWHDLMVRIEGPLVGDLASDFCSTWDGGTQPFDTPVLNGDFILNQCAGRYPIFDEILAMIGRAEHEIIIESPYLLGNQIEDALLSAAERGVQCKLIIPYHSNKFVYRLWVRGSMRRLHHPNITYFGYRGDHDMTHAKLVLVDDRWASFGSLNMFELEGLSQKELNIFSSNPDLLAQLRKFVEADLSTSVALKTPRYAFGRFTYNGAYRLLWWWTQRKLRNPEWKAIYC